MVLVDSSAWIDFFRSGRSSASDEVDRLLEEDEAMICGMVEMEILQGLRDSEHDRVMDLLSALPYLETGRDDYKAAGRRGARLRRRGITIPGADCLIGVLCIRHDLPLLALDKHFDHLPDVTRHPVEAR